MFSSELSILFPNIFFPLNKYKLDCGDKINILYTISTPPPTVATALFGIIHFIPQIPHACKLVQENSL